MILAEKSAPVGIFSERIPDYWLLPVHEEAYLCDSDGIRNTDGIWKVPVV